MPRPSSACPSFPPPQQVKGVRLERSASAPVVNAQRVQSPAPSPAPAPAPAPQAARLMFRCSVCGLATQNELVPTEDGDGSVHTLRRSPAGDQHNCGDGDNSRRSFEEDPTRKSARADSHAPVQAAWFATVKDRTASELLNRVAPGKRGLGRVRRCPRARASLERRARSSACALRAASRRRRLSPRWRSKKLHLEQPRRVEALRRHRARGDAADFELGIGSRAGDDGEQDGRKCVP